MLQPIVNHDPGDESTHEYEDPPMDMAEVHYWLEREEEEARLNDLPRYNGIRASFEHEECDACGKEQILYPQTACTLGYPGHPGAEFTTFHVCGFCLDGGR